MRRTSFLSLGFTLALLLLAGKPAVADPIGITVGFIRISGAQDVESRGFLRSIWYDFEVDDLRLADSDPDYLVQDLFAPKLPTSLWWGNDDGTGQVVLYERAQLLFRATPGLTPSTFTMTGWLKLVNLAGTPLLDQAVSGYGTATWQFVTTTEGGQVVSGVSYDLTPVPEPTGLLLLGSGLAALGVRRWRGRGRIAGSHGDPSSASFEQGCSTTPPRASLRELQFLQEANMRHGVARRRNILPRHAGGALRGAPDHRVLARCVSR